MLSAVPDGGAFLTGFDAAPEVDALLAGGWQGKAAEGFAQGWELWHSGATDVLEALTSMGHLLSVTGQDYQRVDGESADTVNRSGAGL